MLPVIFRKLGFACAALLVLGTATFGDEENAPTAQQVEIRTLLGTIVVELDPDSAPLTCHAFLSYIQKHVYDDSSFYQIDEADIQGGKPGPQAEGFSGAGNFFSGAPAGEFKLKHVRGAIGLSRTIGDCNPTKTTNSTQFYIMRKDFPRDDGQYSIFGHVVQGMDIVDRIADSLTKDKTTPVSLSVVVRLGPATFPKELQLH